MKLQVNVLLQRIPYSVHMLQKFILFLFLYTQSIHHTCSFRHNTAFASFPWIPAPTSTLTLLLVRKVLLVLTMTTTTTMCTGQMWEKKRFAVLTFQAQDQMQVTHNTDSHNWFFYLQVLAGEHGEGGVILGVFRYLLSLKFSQTIIPILNVLLLLATSLQPVILYTMILSVNDKGIPGKRIQSFLVRGWT